MQDKQYFDQYRKDVPVAVTSADKNKEAEKRKLLRETLFNAVKTMNYKSKKGQPSNIADLRLFCLQIWQRESRLFG